MKPLDCKCEDDSWGYVEFLKICTEPEFEDLSGTCFNCYHGRECHTEYWEMFGQFYYGEEKGND